VLWSCGHGCIGGWGARAFASVWQGLGCLGGGGFLGLKVFPDVSGGLGQVSKHVLQAGETDLECIEFFDRGCVCRCALGEKGLDKRVIYEEV
jgi:hypothetical protein